MRTTPITVILFFFLFGRVAHSQGESRPSSSTITLHGNSAGGTLTLMRALSLNSPFVVVTNQAGDSATTVIGRLAEQLHRSPVCAKYYGGNPIAVLENSMTLYDAIIFPAGCTTWVLGGTEAGFSIPASPQAVSASIATNTVLIEWENPPGGYDSVLIVYGHKPWATLPGDANRFVHDRNISEIPGRPFYPSSNVFYTIVGCKNGTPSGGVGIRLINHVLQESLMNVPFSMGISPSFESWEYQSNPGAIRFDQGNLPGVEPGKDFYLNGKGFYQILQAQGPCQGGVSRRFVGLLPGHVYRIGARLNTLGSVSNGWNFTMHAAYNPANGAELSASQMAGVTELPDGSIGLTAGQIAGYQASENTAGQWVSRSSGSAGPGKFVGDVLLPSNNTSITIWFRVTSTNSANCTVGLDSVTLEDLGPQ